MEARAELATFVYELRVDRTVFDRGAVVAACRVVAPGVSVSDDLTDRPVSLWGRVMRRLTINAPPGRWGK